MLSLGEFPNLLASVISSVKWAEQTYPHRVAKRELHGDKSSK